MCVIDIPKGIAGGVRFLYARYVFGKMLASVTISMMSDDEIIEFFLSVHDCALSKI